VEKGGSLHRRELLRTRQQKNNTNKKEEEEVPGFRFGAQSILAPKTYDPLPVTVEPNNS